MTGPDREAGQDPAGEPLALFVNGTLMRGLHLHGHLAGATFLEVVRTSPHYRLHAIDDIHPGMYRVDVGGAPVEGELYSVPPDVLRTVETGEPPHLYRAPVELEDGRWVAGILYPRELAESHPDISNHGGWRAYQNAVPQPASDL